MTHHKYIRDWIEAHESFRPKAADLELDADLFNVLNPDGQRSGPALWSGPSHDTAADWTCPSTDLRGGSLNMLRQLHSRTSHSIIHDT